MDQKTCDRRGNGEDLSEVRNVTGENLKSSEEGDASNTVTVGNSEEKLGVSGGNKDFQLKTDDSKSCKDQETSHRRGIDEPLSLFDQGNGGNLSNSVEERVLDDAVIVNSEENIHITKENKDSDEKSSISGSREAVATREGVINQEIDDSTAACETRGQDDQGSSGSFSNAVDHFAVETIITISTQEAACLGGENGVIGANGDGIQTGKREVEKPKIKVIETRKDSYVIDMRSDASDERGIKESFDGERVCRICHLSSEQSLETANSTLPTTTATKDLIQLGCGCKDELGIAHGHCAEAWFKLKGNRMCEICGQSAKNVTGVGDYRFMEEWNEQGFNVGASSSIDGGGRCWRGQPFCNFLMACLVIAFVLPWFFRVNMF